MAYRNVRIAFAEWFWYKGMNPLGKIVVAYLLVMILIVTSILYYFKGD